MVDGVELVALDQPHECGNSIESVAAGSEQRPRSRPRSRAGRARARRRCSRRAGRRAIGASRLREGDAEELARRSGTPSASAASATLRAGSIPSTGIPRAELAQQVAVVAGDLDDAARRPEAEPLDHRSANRRAWSSQGPSRTRSTRTRGRSRRAHVHRELHQQAAAQIGRGAGRTAPSRRAERPVRNRSHKGDAPRSTNVVVRTSPHNRQRGPDTPGPASESPTEPSIGPSVSGDGVTSGQEPIGLSVQCNVACKHRLVQKGPVGSGRTTLTW